MKATRLAPLLGAPLMTAALLGAAPAGAATPPAANVANIPAAAQPLVAKIAHVPVTSERYSISMTGPSPRKRGAHGKVASGMTTHVAIGEASLAPVRAKLYRNGSSGPLAEVAIGSTTWVNGASLSGSRARPWVKIPGNSGTTLFPLHGGSDVEVDAGGSGPYAELLDLLATADDLQVVGPANVAGRQTTEITATAQPLALVDGAAASGLPEDSTRIEVFVSEAGVPLRVVRTYGPDANAPVETVEVLAVNLHVSVTAPPRHKTISERVVKRHLNEVEARRRKQERQAHRHKK